MPIRGGRILPAVRARFDGKLSASRESLPPVASRPGFGSTVASSGSTPRPTAGVAWSRTSPDRYTVALGSSMRRDTPKHPRRSRFAHVAPLESHYGSNSRSWKSDRVGPLLHALKPSQQRWGLDMQDAVVHNTRQLVAEATADWVEGKTPSRSSHSSQRPRVRICTIHTNRFNGSRTRAFSGRRGAERRGFGEGNRRCTCVLGGTASGHAQENGRAGSWNKASPGEDCWLENKWLSTIAAVAESGRSKLCRI